MAHDTIADNAQPIVRLPEELPVYRLMGHFIRERAHLFLVEDEFGQTAGGCDSGGRY